MNETIGNRIAKLRKAQGLTQEDLANQLGVSSQAVSKWENDASCPDISLLPQLCSLFGITADELLTGKTDEVRVLPEGQRKSLDELILRVRVNSVQGDKIRANLPMPLVKACLEMGVALGSLNGTTNEKLKDIDFSKIMELAERGVIGKLVEVESAEGDIIEVVVE